MEQELQAAEELAPSEEPVGPGPQKKEVVEVGVQKLRLAQVEARALPWERAAEPEPEQRLPRPPPRTEAEEVRNSYFAQIPRGPWPPLHCRPGVGLGSRNWCGSRNPARLRRRGRRGRLGRAPWPASGSGSGGASETWTWTWTESANANANDRASCDRPNQSSSRFRRRTRIRSRPRLSCSRSPRSFTRSVHFGRARASSSAQSAQNAQTGQNEQKCENALGPPAPRSHRPQSHPLDAHERRPDDEERAPDDRRRPEQARPERRLPGAR